MKMFALLGTLGSGKTTLLKEIMEHRRPAGTVLLVINDVGAVNIDATRLDHLGDIKPMTAGCIGCSDLPAFMRVLSDAKAAGVDHLIVEPTGIADGREVKQAADEAGVPMSSVTLVDVAHFERNQALGVMETQLGVAGAVGLTWCDDLMHDSRGVAQPALETVVDFCATHAPGISISLVAHQPTAYAEDVMGQYHSGALDVSATKTAVTCGCSQEVHECGDHHTHHNHHGGHHNHGVYAESGDLPVDFTKETLTQLIAELGETLVRAKGVVGGHTFDFTQGSLQFAGHNDAKPHATFIATQSLGIIERHVAFEGTKKQIMRGYQAPPSATVSALHWQMGEYPMNRALSGEIRVDTEADIIRQLCEREGVPADLRATALQQYVGWRLQSLQLLIEDGARWNDHPDLPYWRRRLGGVLCWHAENVGDALLPEQIAKMTSLDASRHALEGLLGLTELSFQEEMAEERPKLIGNCIHFMIKHGLHDEVLMAKALDHGLALSRANPEWHKRWLEVADQFMAAA